MQEQLFKNIFRKESTDGGNSALLKRITDQYPYFGAAQFYLLKNTAEQATDYSETAARAASFFNDPFLLNSRLKDTKQEQYVETKQEETAIPEKKEEMTSTAEPPEPEKETPLFEPLHASDYFASQGIKLSEEVMPNDKLGMQLKSFTSWLKTMKKVHADKMPAVSAATEHIIQNMAEKSNTDADVVTEAMAEAYLQQEKPEKAREIWHKLSLQNPLKSAYFAAKIESLKQ